MKKISLLLAALLFHVCMALAVPAHPGTVKIQQPDGSYVTIRLVGDEWRHFNTTEDGYAVVKNMEGYYVYAQLENGRLVPTQQVAHDAPARQAAEQGFLAGVRKYQTPDMTPQKAAMKQQVEQREGQKRAARRTAQYDYNNFRGLLILVDFNDKQFSRTNYKDVITDMVNKESYTGLDNAQYTGSVRDYFSDNSGGKFQPEFDVYGPYTVNYSQHDGNSKTNQILKAAIDAADEDVNYANYDRDGDGQVDMIYFILAGYGSNYSGNDEDLWWPHRSFITNNGWNYIYKDGVRMGDYASSVEMYGWQNGYSTLDGIGTICHEFGHVLGLPDFYDTDYEKSGGESNHPGIWSVMAGGSYENYGRTPVGYSLYERWSVGFIDDEDISVIDTEGSYQLNPLYSNYKGYRVNTPVSNEYFLFENRQKNAFKWDAYLPGSGMLVHRVDRTNQNVWNQNTVNANPGHNYYEVVRANGPHKDSWGDYVGHASDVFPGTAQVTSLNNSTSPANLKTWAGKETEWGLKNIKQTGNTITFDVENVYVLKSLELPATMKVGLGNTTILEAVATPSYAHYTLTWTTSNEAVATVDQQGHVTGVKEGTCTIKVTSDNGCEATCEIVVETMTPVNLTTFMQMEEGTEALLQLENAEVLYVYENTAYVRDANGCIMFNNTGLSLQRNDVLNGTVYVKTGKTNGMSQAVGVTGSTNAGGLSITAGSEVQPREVRLENLTEADYSDYVTVKAAQLVKNGGVWAVVGDKRARLWNKFSQKGITVPSDYDGKYFDITALYGTDVLNGEQIDELYLLKSPVEVDSPETAISEVRASGRQAEAPLYNLQGQRVDRSVKGLLIQGGRKFLNK